MSEKNKKYSFDNFSVIVPVLNEEKILRDSARKIHQMCEETKLDFEIIFSENGSEDNTIEILKSICSEYRNSKFISYEKPNYGLAIKNGMMESKYSLITIFDIDYFSKDFLEESLGLDNRFSAIIASKRLASSNDNRTYFRVFISNIYSNILKIFFGTNLSDTHGMKSIKRNAFANELSKIQSDQWMFDTELLLRIEKKGEQIKEVPVNVNEIRPSVYNIGFDIPKTLFLILKLRFRLFFEK